MIDRQKLGDAARKATPGPWVWEGLDDCAVCVVEEDGIAGPAVCYINEHKNLRTVQSRGETFSHADAAFIAAVNPKVVLELLGEISALLAAVRDEALQDAARVCQRHLANQWHEASDALELASDDILALVGKERTR